ncbi:MAG: ATP-binding cassette domain-containing protein [Acidobacteriota bacterium]
MSPDELGGNTTYILVRLAPGVDPEAVRREIRRRLPHNDVHTGPEWAAQSRRYWVESTGLGLNLAMTIFLGCLVGVVVVAQTLYASTMEHIKEFGTVKAIGGSNLDIYRILAEQAAISAVVGFLLGGTFSWLLRPALAKIDLKLIISPSFAAVVGVGTLILCLAAAMISFRKVARIDPRSRFSRLTPGLGEKTMSVLQAHDVTKVFQEGRESVSVLNGASLQVERGEVVALEGPSGSGKTTFLSILGCILTPTSGRIVIDGREVDPRRPDRLPAVRKGSIGFVFQQFNLFPALTALENVEYALNIKGRRGREARDEARRVLEEVGLADRLGFLPRDLSGGQKQRVAIARALAGDPPILLADEPTANLDSQVGGQVLEMFRGLARKENRALLIVTHDPKVRDIADRVVQIRDGRLAA